MIFVKEIYQNKYIGSIGCGIVREDLMNISKILHYLGIYCYLLLHIKSTIGNLVQVITKYSRPRLRQKQQYSRHAVRGGLQYAGQGAGL